MDVPLAMIQALENSRWNILLIPDVLGFDIAQDSDAGQFYFRVHVADVSKAPTGVPTSISGYSVEVVQGVPMQMHRDTTKYPNIKGGIQVGRLVDREGALDIFNSGTLGLIVRDIDNSLELVGLSCAHVLLPRSGNVTDDRIYQPAPTGPPSSQNQLGVLRRSVSPKQVTLPTNPPKTIFAGNVDAAICSIQRPKVEGDIVGIGSVSVAAPACRRGDRVQKRGSETESSRGVITSAGPVWQGPIHDHHGNLRWFMTNQYLISGRDPLDWSLEGLPVQFSAEGDSGSIVVDTQKRLVALLHAGSAGGGDAGIASPISQVAASLRVKLP